MMMNDESVMSQKGNFDEEDNFYNDEEMEYNYSNKTKSISEPPIASSENTLFLQMAFLTVSTSIGGILTGYHLAIVSSALPSLTRALSLDSASSVEIVINVLYLGGIVGSLIGGPFCDFYGRRTCILWTCGMFTFGGLLIVVGSGTLSKICFGRFCIGMAMAMSQIANVSYLTEMSSCFSPPSSNTSGNTYYRGGMVCTNELLTTFGIWFAYYIGYNVTYQEQLTDKSEQEETALQYKYMYAVTLLWAILQWIVMYVYMPESKVWLLQQHQRKYQLVLEEDDDDNSEIQNNSSQEEKNSKHLFDQGQPSFRSNSGPTSLTQQWVRSLIDWWTEGFLSENIESDKRPSFNPSSLQSKEKNPGKEDEYDDIGAASMSSSSRSLGRHQFFPAEKDGRDDNANENYHADTLYDPQDYPTLSSNPSSFMISTLQYNKYALYLLCILAILEQLCGHNVILNYIPELYASAIPNLSPTSPRTSETIYNDDDYDASQLSYETLFPSIYLGIMKIIVTMYAVMEVDRYGRRNLLLAGCVIIALAHIFLLSSFSNHTAPHILQMIIYDKHTDHTLQHDEHYHKHNSMVSRILLTIGLSFLIIGYAISFGPLTHLITSELFPTHIRGRTLAISNLITYVMDYFVNGSFLWIQEGRHKNSDGAAIAPFILYFFNTVIAIGIIWMSVPETMGCILEHGNSDESQEEEYKDDNVLEKGIAGSGASSGLIGVGGGKNLNPSIMSRIEEMWLWQYYAKSFHDDFISNMTRNLESYDNAMGSNEIHSNKSVVVDGSHMHQNDQNDVAALGYSIRNQGASTPPHNSNGSNRSSPDSNSPVLLNMEDYTSFEIVENHDFTELGGLNMTSTNASSKSLKVDGRTTSTGFLLQEEEDEINTQKPEKTRETTTLLEDLEDSTFSTTSSHNMTSMRVKKETNTKLIEDLEHAISKTDSENEEEESDDENKIDGKKQRFSTNHAAVPIDLLYNNNESDSEDDSDEVDEIHAEEIEDVDVNAEGPRGSVLETWGTLT